jgi:hypothetical protein
MAAVAAGHQSAADRAATLLQPCLDKIVAVRARLRFPRSASNDSAAHAALRCTVRVRHSFQGASSRRHGPLITDAKALLGAARFAFGDCAFAWARAKQPRVLHRQPERRSTQLCCRHAKCSAKSRCSWC